MRYYDVNGKELSAKAAYSYLFDAVKRLNEAYPKMVFVLASLADVDNYLDFISQDNFLGFILVQESTGEPFTVLEGLDHFYDGFTVNVVYVEGPRPELAENGFEHILMTILDLNSADTGRTMLYDGTIDEAEEW